MVWFIHDQQGALVQSVNMWILQHPGSKQEDLFTGSSGTHSSDDDGRHVEGLHGGDHRHGRDGRQQEQQQAEVNQQEHDTCRAARHQVRGEAPFYFRVWRNHLPDPVLPPYFWMRKPMVTVCNMRKRASPQELRPHSGLPTEQLSHRHHHLTESVCYNLKGNLLAMLYAMVPVMASSSSSTDLKLSPSALFAAISLRIWGSFTVKETDVRGEHGNPPQRHSKVWEGRSTRLLRKWFQSKTFTRV